MTSDPLKFFIDGLNVQEISHENYNIILEYLYTDHAEIKPKQAVSMLLASNHLGITR